jgi:cell division protein FtsX
MFFRRILTNTRKQIFRSGWSAWASISVMTLAFLISIIFFSLAYFAHLNIRRIESRNNMIVFFEVGMDKQIIDSLLEKWRTLDEIKDISFTSEEEAYKLFSDYTARVSPIHYETLKTFREPKLNSSIDIKIRNLDNFESLKSKIQKDIEEQLKQLIIVPDSDSDNKIVSQIGNSESQSNSSRPGSTNIVKYKYSTVEGRPPIILKTDDTRLEQQREIFNSLRVAGIAVIVLLLIVVFFFIFMTVEFRLHNQMEEIGVMQLVGGSLFFIRAPYILEGAFYGVLGALISCTILGGIFYSVFIADSSSSLSRFFFENYGDLDWPNISILGWVVIVSFLVLIGAFIGGFSSFSSIRRYIR